MLINRGMIWAYFKEQQEESYCWGGMARSVAILLGVFFFLCDQSVKIGPRANKAYIACVCVYIYVYIEREV